MGLGKILKKVVKVVAVVAVVAAVAWVAAPYLGAFGEAIQAGITAVGEAISAGAAYLGEALGMTTGAGTAGTEAAAQTLSSLATGGAEAAGGALATADAASVAAGMGGVAPAGIGAAEAAIGAADGLANAAPQVASMTGAASPAEAIALSDATGGMVGSNLPQVAAAKEGMLRAAGAWVKDNPLVASTLLKGAGAMFSDDAADKARAEMELEEWRQKRLSDSVVGGLAGSNLQYNPNPSPSVLRRTDGTPVYTNTGNMPGGALRRLMPGYGG